MDDERGSLLRLSLTGEYQLHNAVTALTVIDALRGRGYRIPEDAVRAGLAQVQWPARFEVLCRNPLFILDGGHNPQCAEALAESIRRYLPEQAGADGKKGKVVFLMGMLADKDYRRVIDIVSPFAAAFVCLTPDSPRALPAESLAEELTNRGFTASACWTAEEGIAEALALAGEMQEKEFLLSRHVASEGGTGTALTPAGNMWEKDFPLTNRGVSGYPVISFGSLYMAGAVRQAFPAVLKDYLVSCKKRQRKTATKRRRSLTEEERAEKSAEICCYLENIEEIRNARTVFSYAAAPDEVNLDAFNRALLEQGKRVCYPLCGRGGRMSAMFVPEEPDAWRRGAWGIREPRREKASEANPAEIDLVLVPCVVFDRQGGRCGHGAGYYDRFLEKLSPDTVKILIAFDAQETGNVSMEETDIRMDMAVTESGILKFK